MIHFYPLNPPMCQLGVRNVGFIRSDQAMQHHQCDFDGDQLVITPASKMPNIASETRHANQDNEYDAVEKRKKVDYNKATDSHGDRKYTKLRQIAVAIAQNKIGWVATLIGRVQSSAAEPGQPESLFNQQKRQLLGKLFDALQIEVDSPKSATRTEDHHPSLLSKAKQWSEQHPSYLFDYKDDPRLYKTVPLPMGDGTAINCIAREAVNPEWEPTRLKSRHRDEFRYLFESPSDLDEREKWEKHYVRWAQDIKERYRERMGEIHLECGDDSKAIKEAVGKLYESLRADVTEAWTDPEERFLAASAMWHIETANPNLEVPRKACKELSRQLLIEFNLEPEYERLHEAMPKDTHILSVPFEEFEREGSGKTVRDKKRQPVGKELAEHWKELLDSKGIKYEATLHPSLPMVNFALIEPSDKLVGILENKFGGNANDIDSLDLTYRDGLGRTKDVSSRIVAPADYTWLDSQNQTPKAALVLNLFTDEICQQLQTFQFEKAELIGQKYNDFKDVDFSAPEWRHKTFTFEIASVSGTGSRRDGSPIVLLDGQELAMFSANSPKLPIGTTFEATIEPSPKGSALLLNIDPSSVRLMESVEELTEVASTSSQGRSASMSSNPAQGRSPSVPPTPAQNKPPSQPEDIAASPVHLSQLLKDAISEAYNQTGATKIPVGNWTAFISNNRNNLRCLVRDEADNPVLAADLKTGQISKKLSENSSAQFLKYLLTIDAELASTSSKNRVADAQL